MTKNIIKTRRRKQVQIPYENQASVSFIVHEVVTGKTMDETNRNNSEVIDNNQTTCLQSPVVPLIKSKGRKRKRTCKPKIRTKEAKTTKEKRICKPKIQVKAENTNSVDIPVSAVVPRIGDEYQIVCPEYQENLIDPELLPEEETLMWTPDTDIPNAQLDSYLKLSRKKFGITEETALELIQRHKHDLEKATIDLPNFAVPPKDRKFKAIFKGEFYM